MQLLDRFRGCLFGVAAGDALGMPTEGYTAQEIQSKFGLVREMLPAPAGHFHTGLSAGQFTDEQRQIRVMPDEIHTPPVIIQAMNDLHDA